MRYKLNSKVKHKKGINSTHNTKTMRSNSSALLPGIHSIGNNTSNTLSYVLPIACISALLIVGLSMINPTSSNSKQAYADSNEDSDISTQADTTGMSVSLKLNNDNTNLSNNSKTGQVNYISTGFNVTTANVDGYDVYVQTAPGSSNKLTNGSITVDFVKEDTPTSSFTDNTWGYAIDTTGAKPENLKYNPVPDSSTTALNPAYSSSSTGETRDFTINFAAKFGTGATPGHYTTGILLSAVAGTKEVVKGFDDLVYMQDMNHSTCEAAVIGSGAVLKDKRDGTNYTIRKFEDGSCWMTQNLAIAGPTVSSIDSDFTSGSITWTVANSTSDFNAIQSATSTLVYSSGVKYYTWQAAVAINDTSSIIKTVVNTSICPKNWKLPSRFEYQSLFQGVESGAQAAISPFFFSLSGAVTGSGSIFAQGTQGRYWTNEAASSTTAYGLLYYSNSAPGGTSDFGKGSGLPVRCVAR